MAQKVVGYIKLQIPAGKATPAPPVGPALGQHGVGHLLQLAGLLLHLRQKLFLGNLREHRKEVRLLGQVHLLPHLGRLLAVSGKAADDHLRHSQELLQLLCLTLVQLLQLPDSFLPQGVGILHPGNIILFHKKE